MQANDTRARFQILSHFEFWPANFFDKIPEPLSFFSGFADTFLKKLFPTMFIFFFGNKFYRHVYVAHFGRICEIATKHDYLSHSVEEVRVCIDPLDSLYEL